MTPDYSPAGQASGPPPRRRPRHRIWHICLGIFTLEIGLFLLIFPWRDTWYLNYFRDSSTILENIWNEPYFRGALSGLGLFNIVLSIQEFVRAFRRSV